MSPALWVVLAVYAAAYWVTRRDPPARDDGAWWGPDSGASVPDVSRLRAQSLSNRIAVALFALAVALYVGAKLTGWP